MRALVRTTTTLAGAVAVAVMLVPAYAAPSPTPTGTPSSTATASPAPSATAAAAATTEASVAPSAAPSAVALNISARAESGCGVATWTATVADGVPYEIFRNVDGQGWESISTESTVGSFNQPGAEVVAFRVAQGGEANETGPIALFVCDEPTPTPTSTPTVTPTPTPKGSPVTKQVTAKYECGAATFTNPLDVPVTVTYGPAQSDADIHDVTIQPGKSATVESTEKQFGWTARTATGAEVGHRYLPGEDLSCDEPDDSKDPEKKPGTSRGLANTGK